ncbi:MAG: glycosyltransferase family 39 protein [Chloroflexi bacterium]|nr:glycosyltransferase family 39 protein [Chloroflexota bacterium]MBP7041663.1 glycosyltransferase family 39 protein [Chloroflexota bacterium]
MKAAGKNGRWEWAVVAGIILVTAVLRLAYPGLTEFKADEARLLALALDMADGRLALRGISSSVGFPNFPMSVWIYALPLLIWPHVYAATLFTGLLNSLAVLAGYWLVRRYWGAQAAIAATLLFAVSPWAIIFSRKIWAQNLLPLFVMGWAIGAALAFVEKRPRWLWLHLLCVGVAVQIHLAAMALIPATLLFLLVFRRRVVWRDVAVGGVLAALTAVPFLIYLWQNRDQIHLPAGSETAVGWSLDAFRYAWLISRGAEIHSLAGPDAFQAYLARVPWLGAVVWLAGALLTAGLVWLAWLIWRHGGRPSTDMAFIVLVWALLPPLFFTLWRGTPVFIHYFIAVLPAPYIAAGVFWARWVAAARSPIARGAAWAGLTTLAVAQAWALAALLAFVAQTATPGGFGTPLGRQLATAVRAQTMLAESGAAEILAVGPGERPDLDEFPAVWDVLLRGTPHRFVDGRQSALFPAAGAVVVLDSTLAEEGDLYRETAVAAESIALRPGEGALAVLLLPDGAPPPQAAFDGVALLANWVNFLGYDLAVDEAGGTAVWRLHWRTGDNPDPADYHLFNHVQGADGQRLAQVDAAAFAPWQWRAGDVVVSRFVLPWPGEGEGERPLLMRSGMYRYPSLEPVLLLDVAGNPYADALEIPLPPQ